MNSKANVGNIWGLGGHIGTPLYFHAPMLAHLTIPYATVMLLFMDKVLLHDSLISSVRCTFARSSGPGGQNVNKVNTKVYAHVPIASLVGLSFAETAQIRKKLEHSINNEDELYISVQEERSQERNRERALFLLEQKLINAAHMHAKRKKTKPSRAAKEKRLKNKRLKSAIKQLRSSTHTHS